MIRRKVVKTPRVLQDLEEHFHYLGQRSTGAALRFLDDFEEACHILSMMPGIGTALGDDHPRLAGVRYTTLSRRFRAYLIFFRPRTQVVEVLAVIHGARDRERALRNL